MTKEEDDLYADLYNEDTGGGADRSGDHPGDDAIYDEDVKAKGVPGKASAPQATTTTSAGRSSFIPAANTAPPSSTSSFIPPNASTKQSTSTSSAAPPTSRSFIPTTSSSYSTFSQSQTPAANTSRIETAPLTNYDNSGRASNSYAGDQSFKQVLPHEMPDEGKLFVGGLNWDTTDEGLKHYFSQFGKVNYCLIMRDPATQRSRGFAFLTFDDPKAVNSVMVKEHFLDGKIIDPKRAIPRQENVKTAKCFVGGIPSSATPETFKAFFQQYGNVLDSTLMMDRETQRPRGYGFVTYDNDDTVEKLLNMPPLIMDGKMVEVKRATSRNADGTRQGTGSNRTPSSTSRGDSTYSTVGGTQDASSSSFMQANPMAAAAAAMMMNNPMFAASAGGNGAASGGQNSFDPQMMAQFFQQQNWGNANFNPMAFQQMMMGGGMGMNMGMGGMGMGGWGGGGAGMSPWMGGGAGMTGSMSPSAGAGNDTSSPNPSRGGGSNQATSMRGGDRGSTTANRGRNTQAPTSAGLPTRPGAQGDRSRSPNTAGRDYSREKSPERGNNRNGGTRDSRW